MNRVISFSSGKGGVGKTTMVANLGWCLAQDKKHKTLLIDGDWSLGKLGLTLGVRPQWTVQDVLEERIQLKEAILPVTESLHILASPTGVMGLEELNEENRTRLFYEIDALRGQYEFILFDHSSGVNWGVLQFAAASHQHVIVTTTEPTSYTDAYAIMKILSKRFAIHDFSLLVTMVHSQEKHLEAVARFMKLVTENLDVRIQLLDSFGWDAKFSESIHRQKPFVTLYPGHPAAMKLGKLCDRLRNTIDRAYSGLNLFYEPHPMRVG